MNFPARLTRRFTLGAVALATIATSFALTTGTAHASICDDLDANAGQTSGVGSAILWGCNGNDPYQSWYVTDDGYDPNRNPIITLQNVGSDQCLDLDANDIGPGGPITQYGCDSGDTYEEWVVIPVPYGGGAAVLESYGVWLTHDGYNDCIDGEDAFWFPGNGLDQNQCDISDTYQQWTGSEGNYGALFKIVGT
jgi:Ricin-type beta-trefoil lectin domain